MITSVRATRLVLAVTGMALALLVAAAPAAAVTKKSAKAKPAASEPAKDEAAADGAEPAPKSDIVPQPGPKKIDLGNNLTLDLPDGYLYFDKEQSNKLMERMGNMRSDNRIGIVVKAGGDASWMVAMSYDAEGYVKDDDAAKMDADEILNAIKEGNEEANKFREERGFNRVDVEGWTEPPHYEKGAHHLVWGIKGVSKEGASINFNTRVLGRYGYASLNLIDGPDTIEASKPEVKKMLVATTFNNGARYEDFDSSKDKVAEYGLAALVAGGAGAAALKLVKVGLLAKFGAKLLALLIAGKKAIVLLVIGIGVGIKKIFGGGKKNADAGAGAAPPSEPPAAGTGG